MLAPCKPTPLEKHGTEELIDTYPDSKVRSPGGNPTRKNRWAPTPLAFFGGRPPPARRLPSSSRSFRTQGRDDSKQKETAVKRTLILFGVFTLALGIAWQLGMTASQTAPDSKTCVAGNLKNPVPATSPVPDCPVLHHCTDDGCLKTTNCTTTDLGVQKCKQSGGGFFNCPGGQTVHATTCGCQPGIIGSQCMGPDRVLFCQ